MFRAATGPCSTAAAELGAFADATAPGVIEVKSLGTASRQRADRANHLPFLLAGVSCPSPASQSVSTKLHDGTLRLPWLLDQWRLILPTNAGELAARAVGSRGKLQLTAASNVCGAAASFLAGATQDILCHTFGLPWELPAF